MFGIKVFLSHKNEDSLLAGAIAHRLKTVHQIDVYLDVIDRNLSKSGLDLADHIRVEMEKCSHLLAVITSATSSSQWVPWEIGVATEKERPLASFVKPPAQIPEFLEKWPYLRSDSDIDQYARIARTTRLTEEITARANPAQARRSAFREFYTSLRSSLGQY